MMQPPLCGLCVWLDIFPLFSFFLFFFFFHLNSQPFVTIPTSGATKSTLTFQRVRLGLMHKRPSYRPTGTHPSPRSVLVWRSAIRLTSLSWASMPALCTHWSLTANTAPPHWVVTRGSRWLVHRLPCSLTVTRKGSMLWVLLVPIRKQESVSLVTTEMSTTPVIPESGLVQEDIQMTPTHAETKRRTHQLM